MDKVKCKGKVAGSLGKGGLGGGFGGWGGGGFEDIARGCGRS